ncbi:MAG: ABC transporter permease [Solirubrobacteraceae bacterium]
MVADARREGGGAAGLAPWQLAVRRLRRNRAVLGFGALLAVLVVLALAAPLWAHVAGTGGPSRNHLADTIVVDGERRDVVSEDRIPIGPTWRAEYFLGADGNGRDVAVRLLYGARNSLLIGIGATLLSLLLGVTLGLLAGYLRGWVDALISRSLDAVWAFPVLLLALALGVSLSAEGFALGPLHIAGDSKWIPTLIIAVVSAVYLARPIRGLVLSLREQQFVEAARAQGAGPLRIMVSELLPNLASTILVFVPLLVANAILLEGALSFLGAGVKSPEASWGTMLSDGIALLTSAPHLTIVPGVMLVLTVLALNVLGDGLRQALDPRAQIRLEH